MIIKVDTPNGDSFSVEVDKNENMWDVSVKLSELNKEEIVLYNGKIAESDLEDDDTSSKAKMYRVTISGKAISSPVVENNNEQQQINQLEKLLPEHEKREEETAPEVPKRELEYEDMDNSYEARINQKIMELSIEMMSTANEDKGDGFSLRHGPQSLEFLKEDPYFMQMMPLINEHPSYLSPCLEHLCARYPLLISVLRECQDELIQLIVQNDESDDLI